MPIPIEHPTASQTERNAHITTMDDALVEFGGNQSDSRGSSSVMGTIDRVTGTAQITTILSGRDGKILDTPSA